MLMLLLREWVSRPLRGSGSLNVFKVQTIYYIKLKIDKEERKNWWSSSGTCHSNPEYKEAYQERDSVCAPVTYSGAQTRPVLYFIRWLTHSVLHFGAKQLHYLANSDKYTQRALYRSILHGATAGVRCVRAKTTTECCCRYEDSTVWGF